MLGFVCELMHVWINERDMSIGADEPSSSLIRRSNDSSSLIYRFVLRWVVALSLFPQWQLVLTVLVHCQSPRRLAISCSLGNGHEQTHGGGHRGELLVEMLVQHLHDVLDVPKTHPRPDWKTQQTN